MHVTEEMIPPALPIRPDKSLAAFFRLMRNKEETQHVFDFSVNLNGSSLHQTFYRFMEGPNGDLLVRRDPTALLRALDDRDRLRSLPPGTTGRIYADFMDREGLSTNGVMEAYYDDGCITREFERAYPEYGAFIWFLNLTHDMYHILSGYGRDSLGELALLNTTCRITKNRGIKYLAALGSVRVRMEAPELPVFKIMTNARLMGERMSDLMKADFIGMLDRPLREVREELNIVPDPVYAALPQERLLALVQPQTA
ncbi:MAG: Coq4 family protein [Parvularcula sp.]|jgi:ubiquinone biosynthesis protein COQ4|nr:Coq4 family protein [Parvularcula sp.]